MSRSCRSARASVESALLRIFARPGSTGTFDALSGAVEKMKVVGRCRHGQFLADRDAGAAGDPEDKRASVRRRTMDIAFCSDQFDSDDLDLGSERRGNLSLGNHDVFRTNSDG